MAEYWKSTPTHWCKFCSHYIRDTPLERRNHESSARHQNNIQRSLRTLHREKEHAERDSQRAKAEVARLNGLVDGKGKKEDGGRGILGVRDVSAPGKVEAVSTAQTRKAHAEQLAALGVVLPEELRREVTGVGGWEVVSERVVDDGPSAGGGRSLAEILKAEEDGERDEDVKRESEEDVKVAPKEEEVCKGVRKRKADDDDDDGGGGLEGPAASRAWGSRIKTYPSSADDGGEEEDLDALLSGVGKKMKTEVKEEQDSEVGVKKEDENDAGEAEGAQQPLQSTPDDTAAAVKQEDDAPPSPPPPVVFFKKRKGKK